jgi:hypothetical protein
VNSPVTGQPTLWVNSGPSRHRPASVSLSCPGPEFGALLAGGPRPADLLKSVFRVTVVQESSAEGQGLPDVSGHYFLLEDEIRFLPTFPFERNLKYRASFDLSAVETLQAGKPAALEFTIPSENEAVEPTAVTQIFPSCDVLPENLLRFYVHFSNPMQRGRASEQIAVLDSDGQPVTDALYRPPVELWDRTMRRLTVLLDPGRLKRWVGPNVALGPPLKAGQQYVLQIGSGLIDRHGRPLRGRFRKHFLASDPVREPISVKDWHLHRPTAGGCNPLALTFAHSLDSALLNQMIRIELEDGSVVHGQIHVDQCERRWMLTPASPWSAGVYRVRVDSRLEDVCGNTPTAAFDRPLRTSSDAVGEPERISFAFRTAGLRARILPKSGTCLPPHSRQGKRRAERRALPLREAP